MATSNCLAKRMLVAVVLVLFTLPIFSNPFDTIMILTERHSGSVVSIKRDQVFKVVLQTNPTTGYRWEAVSFSQDILRQHAARSFPHSKLYGSGAVVVFQFKALAPGETDLVIAYFRPFEPNKPYKRLFHIKINVT